MSITLMNRSVAAELNLSESGVSRLRSGSRFPSLAVMQGIETAYGWTVQEQSNAIQTGTWAQGFEGALSQYASENATDD